MPNNREWVLFGFLALAAGLILGFRQGRKAVHPLLRIALSRQILIPFFLMVAWVSAAAWAAYRLSIWDFALTTGTVIWFGTAAVVLFFKSTDALKEHHFFRQRAAATLGATAVTSAYVSLVPLDLWAEALLQPFLALVAILSAFAGRQEQYKGLARVLNYLLACFGLGLVIYVSNGLVRNWSSTDKSNLLRGVVLPVWLTAGLIPYIYLLALFSTYQSAVTGVKMRTDLSRGERLRIWLVLTSSLGFDGRAIRGFRDQWAQRLAAASTFREGRRVLRQYRAAWGERQS
jgi:hypothetical protein